MLSAAAARRCQPLRHTAKPQVLCQRSCKRDRAQRQGEGAGLPVGDDQTQLA
jgi:hypothetical protein